MPATACVNIDQSANTLTINVTSVNEAPAGTDNTLTINEDTPRILSAADFGFTDPNDSPSFFFSGIVIPPALHSFPTRRSSDLVTAGQSITVAEINAGHLVFAPAANA